MKSSKSFVLLVVTLAALHAASAAAASVDMDDPRRALGREDDVRIDAQLLRETVSPGSTVGVTYQIQNFSKFPVAIADRVSDISYDADSATITLGFGSEIPQDGMMPRMEVIAPGEKRTFTGGGVLRVHTSRVRSPYSIVPRLVRIKVTVLRELAAFAALLQSQTAGDAPVELTDPQFEKFMESTDTIFLNPIPVRFENRRRENDVDAESGGGFR